MIPLFKSHYSLGKSILKVDKIFEIANDTVFLVEDSMAGFRVANKERAKTGKKLIFGLRLDTKSDFEPSKVIYFAKDDQGIDSLRRIYTKMATSEDKVYKFDSNDLKGIDIAIPFYDSFISRNFFNFGIHNIDFGQLEVTYFEEDNSHPFDFFIKKEIKRLQLDTIDVKSVYYEFKDDFKAYQAFKAITHRTKPPTFGNPNIAGLCSNRFCLEDINN